MPYKKLPLGQAFLQIEEGPVALISASYEGKEDVFCLSWLMPLGFDEDDCNIAIMTGEWNYTFQLLLKSKECVISIPTVSMMKKTITAGTVSGENQDKFSIIGLKKIKASKVQAPIIKGCAAYIECQVIDYIEKYSIVILKPISAGIDLKESLNPKFHARGDGHFYIDGREEDFTDLMESKIPLTAKSYIK